MNLSPNYIALVVRKNHNLRVISGVEIVRLNVFSDERGSLLELFRIQEGEFYVLEGRALQKRIFDGFVLKHGGIRLLEPQAVNAFHYHTKKTDIWTVSPECGDLLVGLIDLRPDSPTYMAQMRIYAGAYDVKHIRIPPMVAHGVTNIGNTPGVLTYFADQLFDPADSDEHSLPQDLHGFDWAIRNG